MLKYKILRGFLIAGVVLGFGSGFAQVGARWAMHHRGEHPHWGQHCRDKDRDQVTPDTNTVKPAPTAARPATTPAPVATTAL
jgi:hypothetical protein